MSGLMCGLVWKTPLPRDEKLLMLCYAEHANPDGGDIWPSNERVRRMTGYSRRSVQIITGKLIDESLLLEDGKTKVGITRYRLNVAKLETMIYEVGASAVPKYISAPIFEDAPEPDWGGRRNCARSSQQEGVQKMRPNLDETSVVFKGNFSLESEHPPKITPAMVYKAYPRHVAPDAAMKAIAKAAKKKPIAYLLERVEVYAKAVKIAGIEKTFIPHPATWFNGGRYDDDASEWLNGGSAPPPNPNTKPITKHNALQ